MERFARAVIRLRIPILILTAVVTGLLAAALPRLTADDDVMQFLPQDDPDIKLFNRVNERFGGLDVAIVGLEADTLFTADRLNQVRDLTRKIGGVEGVFDVLSFTEIPDPRPSPFGLVVEQLVDKVPTEQDELDALRAHVLANENAVGNLISADGRAAMILCFLGGSRPPMHVAADIKQVASKHWTGGSIYYGGAPFIRLHVAGGTKDDIVRLTPVVALVVLVVTFLIFRKPVGVLLALGTVGIALVWLMGLLALRGKGLTLVGSSLPTLLVAIGGAYGIHILAAYFTGEAPTVRERIVEALDAVGAPVAASAATTCAGFLSFLAMDVAPMREFGLAAAIGVAFTALLALLLIPAVLSFGRRVPRKLGAALLARPLGRLGGWAVRNRGVALIVAVLLSIAGVAGLTKIAPDATLKTFFSEGSEPDRANRFLERNFGGSVYLQVFFEGDMRSPFVLAQLRKVVEYARGMDQVVQVNSIIDPLVTMSEAMGGRADLPVSRDRTRSLYPFLDGSAAIDQMVAPEKDASLVQIRFKDVGPAEVGRAVDELSAFVEAEVPRGIKVVELATLPPQERHRRETQIRLEVAARVVRLTHIHAAPTVDRKTAATQVAAVLSGGNATAGLAPGPDLDAAVGAVVDEHVASENSPFEGPAPDAAAEELAEWEQRGAAMRARIEPLAVRPIELATITGALEAALPRTAARDPEGLELTAEAITAGLTQAVRSVRAERLVTPALVAAGVEQPDPELERAVAWAITDIDVPDYGFPDGSSEASPVLARVTGQPVINVALCDSTIRNQLRSLALALVVLTLILSIAFRSVVSAVKGLAPPVFMLALAVGVMGAAAIPLDMSTSMIAAIALGIGVDYSIHFLWRRRRRGESLARTTAQVGPSIASNAVQVAAGFAVLSLSDMVPMQRFGMLVALTMVLSAAATFVLLPALRAEGAEATEEDEAREPLAEPTRKR